MKHISLIKLTEEGRKHLPEAQDVFTKATQLVDSLGGKIVGIWATTGRYDFVAVVEYSTADSALKAHTKLLETRFFVLESCEAFDMDAFLASV